jgi:RimJ/RimL family protein N-acetyltransferase
MTPARPRLDLGRHLESLSTDQPDLVLRELTVDDVDAYYALVDRNRAHLNRHGNFPFERDADADAVRSYFEHPWDANVRLGIWSGHQLVGRVDLNPIDPPRWVLGYWLDEASTGRGIVTSACRAAIAHLGTMGATELYAAVTHGNEPSIRVLRRVGFEHIQDVEDRSRWRLALVEDPPPPVMA